MSSPATWKTFLRISKGKEYRFRIMEIQKNKYDEVFDLYYDYFVPDEPINKAAGTAKNETALEEHKKMYRDRFEKAILQIDACFVEDGSNGLKMVAGSIMKLEKKGDPDFDFRKQMAFITTKEVKAHLTMVHYIYDVLKKGFKNDWDLFYGGFGLVVHPDYRLLGIAEEILKTRVSICKAHRVPMTCALMTSVGTQKAATRLGWETVLEINYKDLEEVAKVTIAGAPLTVKFMITRVLLENKEL